MTKKHTQYLSGKVHDRKGAYEYSKTADSPHRFLAYRDFPSLTNDSPNIHKAVDLGCGTGCSSCYLFERGIEVLGVDKCPNMVMQAKESFPQIKYLELNKLQLNPSYDLVFSSFVLFELPTKEEIIQYLNTASSLLSNNGIFYGITGSEYLHQTQRNWAYFDTDFPQNRHPRSGDIVKLQLKEPEIEFSDYYWTEADYSECFEASSLKLTKIHYPLGNANEVIRWNDELFISPYVIFIATKFK